jgi:protein-disulfide isomerase
MSAIEPGNSGKPTPGRSGLLLTALLLLALGLGVVLWRNDNDRSGGDSGVPIAQSSGGGTFSGDQTRAIERIVKDYLVAHPELLLEMQGALEAKMAREEAEKTKGLVQSYAKELYRKADDPVAGNPNGDITVVEFFDYNCGYCKRGFGGIAKLIESDKNVRFVFKDLPIIRDESEGASRVALAAKRQGKYWEVHQALIKSKGTVNEAEALKAAEKLGLDMAKLKADTASAEVKSEIEGVKALAQKMGINGTPHFLVGDKAIGGAPENLFEILEEHVAELRKTGCAYC